MFRQVCIEFMVTIRRGTTSHTSWLAAYYSEIDILFLKFFFLLGFAHYFFDFLRGMLCSRFRLLLLLWS